MHVEDHSKDKVVDGEQMETTHTGSLTSNTKVYLIAYGAAFTVAELITVLVHPMWGVVFHIVLLTAIIAHSSIDSRLTQKNRQLILSMALVPLVRILSLTMPLINIPQTAWYPVIYTPLVAAGLVVARISGYSLKDIGFRRSSMRVQLAITATGIGLGFLEYLILRPPPFVSNFTVQDVLPSAIIFVLFIGFGEELIFRGVLQRTATDAVGTRIGIGYVSFLFAILHMGFLSWLNLVFVFAVAIFFGWLVKKTGSLLGVTLSHGLTNIILYLIAPFLF